jgi:hypothetical protein
MQKENPISFACLVVSYFQTKKWYFACLYVSYFQTATKWYCTVEYQHVKKTISDDRRMQKGEYDIFCMLGRIVLSNNKMVLYRTFV